MKKWLEIVVLFGMFMSVDYAAEYEVINLGVLQSSHVSYATALNDHNQVVGNSYRPSYREDYAFLWEEGQPLQELVPCNI